MAGFLFGAWNQWSAHVTGISEYCGIVDFILFLLEFFCGGVDVVKEIV